MNRDAILRVLEESYLELAGRYGEPVLAGNRDVWGWEGLFERVNKKLTSMGIRELTWEEFTELLKSFDKPKYYGKVYVTFVISPRGKIEPHDIAIYGSLR